MIPTDEQISALMDGELIHPETNHLITAMQKDQGSRTSWERYHLIGDALRKNLPADMTHNLAARVHATLADEPTVLAPRTTTIHAKIRQLKPALRQIGGLAIAASVTALTILTLQPGTGTMEGATDSRMAAVAPATSPVAPAQDNVLLVSGATRWDRLGEQPQMQSKLNAYLNNHHEYAAPAGIQGVLPDARLVGYGAAQ